MIKFYTKTAVIVALAAFAASVPAFSQVAPIQAQVVTACGTPQTPYSAGQTRPATQDTTGTLCTVSGGGGGGGNVNLTGINGVTPVVGAGATGTGSLRTTTAQDATTIAGSAPGVAGTPSANVVSVQGVAGGTVVPISGSVTITGPLGNQAPGSSVSVTNAVGSTLAPAVVALSTTSAQVLATGSTFVSRVVCNDDSAIIEYFGPASVTTAGANGVKLSPGQCWDFSHNTAAVFGVSASATPNARVVQY